MSKLITPTAPETANQVKVPHEKIAMRAYEKWVQRGRPQGTPLQDWIDAEKELRTEQNRHQAPTPSRR